MSNYLKPQSPLQKGTDYIYPLTTVDQVIIDEAGTRLGDGKGSLNVVDEEARATASNAQSTANAAMPKSGGTFTGVVTLANQSYVGGCGRNILVQNNGGTANVSTQYIIMQRK